MWKIFDKLQLFIVRFFKGLKFAAIEYDVQLKRTVTSRQRITTWIKIIIAGIFIAALLIFVIRQILFNFDSVLSVFKKIIK